MILLETRDCGCETWMHVGGQVARVGTCPSCLPVGAITWLIENGRQLELFEEPPEIPGVVSDLSGGDPEERTRVIPNNDRSSGCSEGLPF